MEEGPGTCHMQGIMEGKNIPFGRFPLGFCSLGDHFGGDAAVRDMGTRSCSSLVQIQSDCVTRASKGKIWKCQHLPESMFSDFCIHSLQSFVLARLVFMAVKRTTL